MAAGPEKLAGMITKLGGGAEHCEGGWGRQGWRSTRAANSPFPASRCSGRVNKASGAGNASWENTACTGADPLSQRGIQRHHQGESDHEAQSGVGLMAIAVGFGDHLVGDHEQHGAGGEPEPHGVGDGHAAGESHPEQGTKGLQQAAGDGHQHGDRRAKTGGAHGERHRQSFGNVLQGDGGGERQPHRHVPLGEADANGHALRQVVQGDGEHEQPDPGAALVAGAAGARIVVLVGGELIQPQHQQHPEGHAGHHHGGGEKAVAGDPLGRLQARQQQGEGAGGQHHAGRKAQHGVFHPLGDGAQKQGWQCAQRRGGKTGGTAEEAIAHAGGDVTGRQHDQTLHQEQQHGDQGEQQPQGDEGAICYLLAQLDRPGRGEGRYVVHGASEDRNGERRTAIT